VYGGEGGGAGGEGLSMKANDLKDKALENNCYKFCREGGEHV